jgi:hypothetical protein
MVSFNRDFLLLFGAMFLVLSVLAGIFRVALVITGRRVRAVVVRHVGTTRTRFEMVRLLEPPGTEARVVAAGRSVRPVGTEVEVLVSPLRAGRVLNARAWDVIAPPVIGFVVGAAMIGVHFALTRFA